MSKLGCHNVNSIVMLIEVFVVIHSAALHSHIGGSFTNHEMTSGGSKCGLRLQHGKGVKTESTHNHKHRDEDGSKGGEDEEHDVKSMHKVIRESGTHHPGKVKLYVLQFGGVSRFRGRDRYLHAGFTLLIDLQDV